MFNQLVETVQSVSTLAAKATVGGAGAVVGGVTGLVVGTITGAVMGTATGAKAGCEMAIGFVWPASHETPEAGEVVENIKAEIKAEITSIQEEMRDLAGPAKPAKRGPGRPRKNRSYGPGFENVETAKIKIDGRELDDQEVRDFLSGKAHLRPDPVF